MFQTKYMLVFFKKSSSFQDCDLILAVLAVFTFRECLL